jgi:hypothetical protein
MKTDLQTSFDVSYLQQQTREDQYIASLDPLQADESIQLLPVYNQTKDTIAMVLLLVDLLPSISTARTYDFYQAAAAMRDLGMLLGSMKRHGIEPVNVIPDLEDKLNLLGAITQLPPRDTLLHYTIWNPTCARRRMYTATSDEIHLIDSVLISMNPLQQAILHLKELHEIPLSSPLFAAKCEDALKNYEKMVDGIVHARKNVSTQYFSQELRFYFDPIILNEKTYLGPGAVEMPVFVFDHLLWGSDCQDKHYKEFKYTYLPYVQSSMREVFTAFEGKSSLLTQVCNSLDADCSYSERTIRSAKALLLIGTRIKSFRMPHKKMADEAYKHQGEGKREKGSGGYTPEILSHILDLTLTQFYKLENSMHSYQVRHNYLR